MAARGWYADPTRRHEYRYHNGTIWTPHVADQGNVTVDPVTAFPGAPPSPGGPLRSPGPFLEDSLKRVAKWADKQMEGAAEWVVDRGGMRRTADAPILDHEPSATVLGQWSGLAGAVQRLAIAMKGPQGTSEVLGVLRAVTGSEDAQERLLKSIDVKVDALVKGPYKTGRTYLLEAQRLGADDPATLSHVERAKDAFYQAHGQAASVQSRSLVEYHLGLTWLLLGRRGDATHWLARSHASAVAVIEELARCSKNIRVLRSRDDATAAACVFPAGIVVLGMRFKKMVAAQRARRALEDLLPFVDCVARCHNSVAGSATPLSALSIHRAGENHFDLVPIKV